MSITLSFVRADDATQVAVKAEEDPYNPLDFLPDDARKAIETGKQPERTDLGSMMERLKKIDEEELDEDEIAKKKARLEIYFANMTVTHGANASAIQRCMFSNEIKN